MSKITIQDVAAYANVSRATVSRVLNNHPTVADELRQRVLEAIEALGYQPNRAARRLRAKVSDTLGLIISDIQNPFFLSVVRSVEDAAYDHLMSVLLCNTDEDLIKQQKYLQVMRAEGVAGLIITPAHAESGEYLRELCQSGMPIILLDRQIDGFTADTVIVDNVHGAYTAVNHLIGLGYRRIATIGGAMHLSNSRDRYQGYRNALGEAGIPIDEALIKSGDFKTESGYRLARELLALSDPPRALFTANNLMTLGAVRAMREMGVRVPEEVAIVGFDDTPWATELYTPLTVISQPTYELGQEAMRLFLRRRANPNAPVHTVVLHTHLIVRDSCGATS